MTLVDSITKWKGSPMETKRVAEYVSMAYRNAVTGRPGPVYLEVPQDVLGAEVEETEVTMPANFYSNPAPQATRDGQEAVELLLNARDLWFLPAAASGGPVRRKN